MAKTRGWEGTGPPQDPDRAGQRRLLVPSEAVRCARPAPDYRPPLRDRLARDRALRLRVLGDALLIALLLLGLALATAVRSAPAVGEAGLLDASRASDASYLRTVLRGSSSSGPPLRAPDPRG